MVVLSTGNGTDGHSAVVGTQGDKPAPVRERAPGSALGDDVHRMHDARDVAAQGQQDIQPERTAEPHLQEHSNGGNRMAMMMRIKSMDQLLIEIDSYEPHS